MTESAGGDTGTSEADEPSIRRVMRRDVPTVAPSTTVSEVARLLASEDLSGVPVLDGDVLVGIITEWDVIAREAAVDVPPVIPFLDGIFVADGGRDFDEEVRHVFAITAGELMTAPVYSVRDIATLAETATLMVERRISTVPVVDAGNRIVGLVTRSDLVRVIASLESASR
ncbi:MAG: CBS domain-containing protein [Chloroflexota bacterium]|nr:CBS domain-containing protein [Chloroflexia bacterium]MDQ3167702.1 CBS domain-containing protein [Chloroflexota bacterium]MDQ3514542.1 CBS domain-containing protein [Chloroflexota bacterium]